MTNPRLPYLPWLKLALLIRSITGRTWDEATWPMVKARAAEGTEDAGGDDAGRLVELNAAGRRLRAALAAVVIPVPRGPELALVHRWLDSWTGVGLIAVGMHRQGLRLSLSHVTKDEWRAAFMTGPMFAPSGFGVATTPWGAVQRAGWVALGRV